MRKLHPFLLGSVGLLALTVGCAQPMSTSNVPQAGPIDDPAKLPQKLSPNQVIQVSYDQIEGLTTSKYQIQRRGGGGFGGRGFGGRGFGGRGYGGFGRWGGAGWGGRYWGAGWGPSWYGGAYWNSLALYPYSGYYYPYYFNAGAYYPYWSTPYTYGAGMYSPYYWGTYPYNYSAPAAAVPPYASAQQVPPVNITIAK